MCSKKALSPLVWGCPLGLGLVPPGGSAQRRVCVLGSSMPVPGSAQGFHLYQQIQLGLVSPRGTGALGAGWALCSSRTSLWQLLLVSPKGHRDLGSGLTAPGTEVTGMCWRTGMCWWGSTDSWNWDLLVLSGAASPNKPETTRNCPKGNKCREQCSKDEARPYAGKFTLHCILPFDLL